MRGREFLDISDTFETWTAIRCFIKKVSAFPRTISRLFLQDFRRVCAASAPLLGREPIVRKIAMRAQAWLASRTKPPLIPPDERPVGMP